MPNYSQLPATNLGGQVAVSTGDGQGGSKWMTLQNLIGMPQVRSYAVSGTISVPSGASGYLPSHYVWLPNNAVATLVGIAYYSRTAGVTFEVYHNGSALGSPQTWTTTTSWQIDTSSVFPVTCATGDYLAPVVTSVSGTPDGLGIDFLYVVSPQ